MKAIITCLISGEYTLYDEVNNIYLLAKPRGIFRNKNQSPKVGDIVEYSNGIPHAIIEKVYDRKNDFIRPAICNIDQAFIVTSVKEPFINTNLLDRMITIFEYQNIVPILVFSKMDLLTNDELKEVESIVNYYQEIGYVTIQTSTKDVLSTNDIKQYLKNKVSVITGQSGVGKSSILNILDVNINLDTAEISKALNRGKHTTRITKLYNLYDGWLADTPGFGTMELIDMEKVDVAHSFTEFFEKSQNCKYSGCLHLNEPHCAIKKDVEENKILKSRYENYLQFIKEIENRRKW